MNDVDIGKKRNKRWLDVLPCTALGVIVPFTVVELFYNSKLKKKTN